MIGTVSTGRCPMPPARDRSGMQFNFFADLWNFRPKVIILSSSSEIFLQGNEIRYQKDPIFWMIKFCFLSRYKRDDMGAGYCTPHQTEKVIFCLFLLHHFAFFHILFQGFTGCGYGHCVGDIVCIGCWTSSNQFKYQTKNLFIFSLTVNMQKDWTALCQINISIC